MNKLRILITHGFGYGYKKYLLIMKITTLLCFISLFPISASIYSQNTSLSLKVNNKTVKEVLEQIEQESKFHFLYNDNFVDLEKKVNLEVNGMNIDDVLKILLSGSASSYKILDNNLIVIAPVEIMQQQKITGTITDATNGEPIIGANVVIEGTTIGTVTDANGKFTLNIQKSDAVLVISILGYNIEKVTLVGQAVIEIKLVPDITKLDEVVVVGYGTMKKSDLTGSVSRTSISDNAAQANTNLMQALSGASAGVNIQAAGLAGSEPSISIRGQTSLSASDKPLIVLDGIIYNGEMADINISDVESVDILKDASSAAVYGSRSANGVMLITTKKGKSDKPTISFNMAYGFQDMTNNPIKPMNAEQYAIRLVDFYYQQGLYAWYRTNPTSDIGKPVRPDVTDRTIVAARLRTQEERDNYLAGNEINWVDEVTRIAPIQNYNLSFSGRTERSNYFVSASYANEEGIQLNDQFSRFTIHSNVESKVTNWLTIGLNTSYSYRDYSGLEADLGWNQTGALSASPLANNKIGMANYDMFLTGEAYMPYPLNNLYVTNSDIRNNLFLVGNAKVTIPWVKGLTYELNYSNTYSNRNNNTFYPVTTPSGAGNKGQAIKKPSEQRNSIVNNIVTYLRRIGDHQINATLLYSRENNNAQSSTLNAQGFDNQVLGYNNMGLGTVATVASTAWEENSISYMARANYSYKNRYMITGTVRRDGFSGFGPNNKFANFPSLSLGWVASEEGFLQNVNGLYLKLRTSYGINGNQGIGRYSSFSTMGVNAYTYGSSTVIAVYPSTLGNADLSWETTASFNVGFDYGILNQRISGSIDVYKAKTSDVLVQRVLPPTAGYASVWANIGEIDNKGIELALNTINLKGKLNWTTNFNFSLNRNKISKLYGGETDKDIGNSWFVGESINSIYDYEFAGGLWTEKELYEGKTLANWYPGQYKYLDQNNDGVIEPIADRKIIGNKSPNYSFSINNSLTYNNFTFSFLLNSIQGGNGYFLADNSSVVNVSWNSDNVYRVNAAAVRPYWTPDNGVNNATGVYNTPAVHGGIYEDRSFVRLQDVSLSYKFSNKLLKTYKIDGCQFFVSGKNLYTWTKWSGWDPEIGVSNSPLLRNITVGFKLTL